MVLERITLAIGKTPDLPSLVFSPPDHPRVDKRSVVLGTVDVIHLLRLGLDKRPLHFLLLLLEHRPILRKSRMKEEPARLARIGLDIGKEDATKAAVLLQGSDPILELIRMALSRVTRLLSEVVGLSLRLGRPDPVSEPFVKIPL